VTADGSWPDGKYGKCVAAMPIWVTRRVPMVVRIFAYFVGKLCRRLKRSAGWRSRRQRYPTTAKIAADTHRIDTHHGTNIATLAAARKLLTLV
jgi:hypothetical protein